MTAARYDYFASLTAGQAARVRSEARRALRLAWQGRHVQPRRARLVIAANLATLRDLQTVTS